jgi:hypothetical protein
MRTALLLSTLFAVSTIGGAALAEKPQVGTSPREPRVIEHIRAHGDTVDKSYRPEGRDARPGEAPSTRATPASAHAKPILSRGESRVNCSDTGVDCTASHGKAQGQSAGAEGGHASRPPAFLDKILGNDRTNFNEAGEDQGMSLHAAQRAWSRASAARGNTTPALTMGTQRQVDRKSLQASDARMSCNEADECSMSTKAMRKVWAEASIKAGTWTGPAKEPVSNAALRITAQRAAEGAGAAKADREKAGDAGHGAEGAGRQAADHPD